MKIKFFFCGYVFNFCLVFVMLYIMAERKQKESLFTPQIAMSVLVCVCVCVKRNMSHAKAYRDI